MPFWLSTEDNTVMKLFLLRYHEYILNNLFNIENKLY